MPFCRKTGGHFLYKNLGFRKKYRTFASKKQNKRYEKNQIALYIAMDSFGTACNVTGDGAIAVVMDKIFRKDK